MIPHDEIRALVARNRGQMTAEEYARVYDEIERVAPARVIIFGAGRDTFLWVRANTGGETHVVDDSKRWLMEAQHSPELDLLQRHFTVYRVRYTTRLEDWRALLDADLPMPELGGLAPRSFDLALVDGPHGEGPQVPGRMQPIFMAAVLVRPGGTVLVHDVHRKCERLTAEARFGRMEARVKKLGVWRAK